MFPGFSEDALKFLRSLKRNNRREWFQPRKEIFDSQLRDPMLALIEQVNARLIDIAPAHVTEPKKALFRIYRDTRFSANKAPYKTHIAAWFPNRAVGDKSAGGFYFHISGEEAVAAGGCYMPPPDQLRVIRTHLLEHHERFRLLAAAKPVKKLLQYEGEALSRDPKGFPKDHPAADLIRQKQWGWHATHPAALALTPKLLPMIAECFAALAPLVAFLNEPFAGAKKPRREIFFD